MNIHLQSVCVTFCIRMGALVLDETKLSSSGISMPTTTSSSTIKAMQRPFGVGVLNLATLNLLELPFASEFELPEALAIYRPSHDAETMFATLHEDIISRRESEYELVPHSRGIALSFALIEGVLNNDINILNKDLKTKVLDATRTYKIRQEYILDPREQREEMFVAIRSGNFSQGSKTAARNIEITARIVGEDGTVFGDCIVRGTGKQTKASDQYTSTVYRHVNNPTIQEIFRVLLPQIPNLLKCHLLLTASHCSTNSGAQSSFMGGGNKKQRDMFAFAYLLFENAQGSLINNGDHFLECFTPLPGMETGSTMSACYLKGEKTRLKRRTIRAGISQTTDEHIIVGTSVTSVTYSSVRALNSIMRWETAPESDLRAAMTTFATSNESDAIRYVRDVLDKASRIMTQRTVLAPEAFSLFMNLLAVFHKNAMMTSAQDTEAVLEAYADVIFSNDRVYFVLLSECNRTLSLLDSASASRSLYPIDKNIILCLPLLLHLVHIYYERCTVIERQSSASNAMQMIDVELQDELSKMIGHLTSYLNNCEMENEVSCAIYDVYFEVFSIIETFFTFEDMSVFAGDFMCSFLRGAAGHKHRIEHSSADVKRKKMTFLRNIMGTSVFDHSEARRIMLPRIVDIINYFMPDIATRDITCEVLQILLDKMAIIGDTTDKATSLRVLPSLVSELSGVMHLLSDSNRSNLQTFLVDATCCLCTLVGMLLTDGESLLERGIGDIDGRSIALHLLLCMTDIIKKEIVQPTWILISMTVINTAQQLLVWMIGRFSAFGLLQRMNEKWEVCVGSRDYEIMVSEALLAGECTAIENIMLYTAVFNLGYTIIMEPALATHSAAMNPTRKQYLTHHYTDVRDPIIDAMTATWTEVKPFWARFCSHFTVPALAAACSSFEPARIFGTSMILDLLRADFSRQQDFRLTAAHVYDSVRASLVDGANGSAIELRYLAPLDAMMQFIGVDMKEIFKNDATLNHSAAFLFVNEMKELLRLLLDLARCPKTPDYEEERSFAYGRLMDFLLKMGRLDAYIKCAHSLSKELENMELHTEAGNAILLHCKLLQWRSDILDPLELNDALILHAAPEWERKKYLLEEALDLLEKGKCYEMCIELLNELEMVYTKLYPDYVALTEEVLERKISYYKNIIDADRFFPTMFRVGYYGAFENASIRNKEFIYRGMPLESIIDFTSRIKKKFPKCELLPPKITPTDEHFYSSTQYIQLSKVTPANVLESEGKQVDISMLPGYIRVHLQNNNVQCFYYQKPFRKRATKSANEFLDLWVEKKFMITDVVFPSYSRRAEVTRTAVVELNPIEMAVVGLQERNADLAERNTAMRSMPDNSAAQAYTMALRYEIFAVRFANL